MSSSPTVVNDFLFCILSLSTRFGLVGWSHTNEIKHIIHPRLQLHRENDNLKVIWRRYYFLLRLFKYVRIALTCVNTDQIYVHCLFTYDKGSAILVIRSVPDVLRSQSRFVKFLKPWPSWGPKYVSDNPCNEFNTPTTFIYSTDNYLSISNVFLLPNFGVCYTLDLEYAVTLRQCCGTVS